MKPEPRAWSGWWRPLGQPWRRVAGGPTRADAEKKLAERVGSQGGKLLVLPVGDIPREHARTR